ncbi:AMP-binding protein [uncultured Tateyamaria sp.]|uniref:AMP-binding protein n=1 Tax=uncultured Tateyamaria sp. TaxID=455651 RepID=UPI00261E7E67|nr:AMP-binding protein [uncultured Tateyamaria sp.]
MSMEAHSVLEALHVHIKADPNHMAFHFVRRPEDEGESLSVSQLWQDASVLAGALPDIDYTAQTGVMLFCREARLFITAMMAVWMRGATVIPATGGMTAGLAERNRHVIATAQPDVILHDLNEARATELKSLARNARTLDISNIGTAPHQDPFDVDIHNLNVGQLLQFTSGSTNAAKAVLLTQEDIVRNAQHSCDTYGIDRTGTSVHWLPLYHDMGLIGSVLTHLYAGQPSVLLRPSVFIQAPLEWLNHMDRWRATLTSSPNFAFETLLNKVDARQDVSWDLSNLRTIVCGGEPVRQETMERLADRLGRHRLSKAAIAPSYGMAEAVLMISSGQKADGPVFRKGESGNALACLGVPGGGIEVEVRDPQSGAPVQDGVFGEVWINGPGCGRVIPHGASWRDARDKGEIRTGDWGMMSDGELYIAGRDSDRIILRGRNILAEDVEAIVYASQPEQTAAESVAAFGVPQNGTEVLYVLVERKADTQPFDERAFFAQLGAQLDIKCEKVQVVPRGSLVRTTSGKIRRGASRDLFLKMAQQ